MGQIAWHGVPVIMDNANVMFRDPLAFPCNNPR